MGGLHLIDWAPVALVLSALGAMLALGRFGLRRSRTPPSPHLLRLLRDLREREAAGEAVYEADIPAGRIRQEAWDGGFLTHASHPAGDHVALSERGLQAVLASSSRG